MGGEVDSRVEKRGAQMGRERKVSHLESLDKRKRSEGEC